MNRDTQVVVTGMGVVSPVGIGVAPFWENLKAGISGIRWLTLFDDESWPVRYAGEVPAFNHHHYLKKHSGSKRDRTMLMGLVAAAEALDQARLIDDAQENRVDFPIGVVVGSGMGPSHEIEFSSEAYYRKGPRFVRPTSVAKGMLNALSSRLSIHYGLRGANHVIAAACASSTAAIGQAYTLIKAGQEEVVLTGGADSPLHRGMFTGWTAMRVMAEHEDPQKACRPFDRQRNGLVLGEGSAMIVLESEAHALHRGAPILGRVLGYGAASDAFHITAPTQEGQMLALRRALADARVAPGDIDYVNAHGTGTRANDVVEASAIAEVLGARGADMPVNSTKSMTAHSLGACGALELVATVESMREGYVHPTLNCDEPDPDIGLDYVPHVGRPHPIDRALLNTSAFGGNNSVLILGRYS